MSVRSYWQNSKNVSYKVSAGVRYVFLFFYFYFFFYFILFYFYFYFFSFFLPKHVNIEAVYQYMYPVNLPNAGPQLGPLFNMG